MYDLAAALLSPTAFANKISKLKQTETEKRRLRFKALWSGCKTFKDPQIRGLTAAVSLSGAHKFFSSFQLAYFQRKRRQAV